MGMLGGSRRGVGRGHIRHVIPIASCKLGSADAARRTGTSSEPRSAAACSEVTPATPGRGGDGVGAGAIQIKASPYARGTGRYEDQAPPRPARCPHSCSPLYVVELRSTL